jgi:thiol:disulfide interchange protein DsbC
MWYKNKMRKILIIGCILFAVSAFFLTRNGESIEKCEHECTKCHKTTNEEIFAMVKEIIPQAQILEVRPAPVKGLWETAVEKDGKKGIIYVDFSKKMVITGAIFDMTTKANLTQERMTELNKVDLSKIPLDDALVIGDKEAKHKVIVFTDTDCPYCAKLHHEIKKVIEKRKDVAFYVMLFPLKMHPNAYEKSKTILCEKSLSLLDDAFEKKEIPKPDCDTTQVDNIMKLGESLGITGTPALILPDGSLVPGYKDADSLISLIDKSG